MEITDSSKATSNFRKADARLDELRHLRYAIVPKIITNLESFMSKDPELKMEGKFGAMENVIEFRKLTKQIAEMDHVLKHSEIESSNVKISSDHIVYMSGAERVAFAGIFRIKGRFAFVQVNYATNSNIEVKDSKKEVIEFLHSKGSIDKNTIEKRLEYIVSEQVRHIKKLKRELDKGKQDLAQLKKKIEAKEEKWLYKARHF